MPPSTRAADTAAAVEDKQTTSTGKIVDTSNAFVEPNSEIRVERASRQTEVVIQIEELDTKAIWSDLWEPVTIPLEAIIDPELILKYQTGVTERRQGMLELAASLHNDPWSPQLKSQEDSPKEYVLFPKTPWLPSALVTHQISERSKEDPVFSTCYHQCQHEPGQVFDFNTLKVGLRNEQPDTDMMSRLFEVISVKSSSEETPKATCPLITAKDFRLSPSPRPQLTTDVVSYHMELLEGSKRLQPFLDPSDFRVTLIKPNRLSVNELTIRPDPRGMSFSVSSNQSGYHKLVVMYTAFEQKPEEICGSPFTIKVVQAACSPPSQNYGPTSLSFLNPVIDFKPRGFAEHRRRGLVYITESYYNKIHVMDLVGVYQFVIEIDGFMIRGMNKPSGIAVCEGNDRLYVTDRDNHRVLVFNWDGVFLTEFGRFGDGKAEFSFPWGIAVSPDATLLAVADTRNRRVQLFHTDNLTYINEYSVYGTRSAEYPNMLDFPGDLLFDSTGLQLYVSDFNTRAIIIIDVSLLTQRVFATFGFLKRPQGMSWDLHGNLLVADSASGKVLALDANEKPLARPQGWQDIPGPVNVLQLQNGLVMAVTERNGVVILHDPRKST